MLVAFSPDGEILAYFNHTLLIIQKIRTKRQLHSLSPNSEDSVVSLQFSDDGTKIILGCANAEILEINVDNGEIKSTRFITKHKVQMEKKEKYTHFDYSKSVKYVLGLTVGNTIRIYDKALKKCVAIIEDIGIFHYNPQNNIVYAFTEQAEALRVLELLE